jgi:hypothetical protein
LRRTNFLHFDLGHSFDSFDEALLLSGVKSDANSAFTSSSCSTGSVNVGINFFGWLKLNNQVNFRDVKSSCCDIGGNEALEFTLLKGLESDLPLFLGDVSVKDLGLLLEVGFEQDFVGFPFGFTENDGSAVSSSVKVNDVSDDGISMVVRAVEGHVFDSFGGSHASILN